MLSAFGFELARFRGDCDRFRGRTDLQHDIHARGDRDLYLDIGLFVFAEPRLFGRKRVSADGELKQRVIARSCADGFRFRARLNVGENDGTPGTTAPPASETVPVTVPRLVCPNSEQESRNTPIVSLIFNEITFVEIDPAPVLHQTGRWVLSIYEYALLVKWKCRCVARRI